MTMIMMIITIVIMMLKETCWLEEYASIVSRAHDPKLKEVHLNMIVTTTMIMMIMNDV